MHSDSHGNLPTAAALPMPLQIEISAIDRGSHACYRILPTPPMGVFLTSKTPPLPTPPRADRQRPSIAGMSLTDHIHHDPHTVSMPEGCSRSTARPMRGILAITPGLGPSVTGRFHYYNRVL